MPRIQIIFLISSAILRCLHIWFIWRPRTPQPNSRVTENDKKDGIVKDHVKCTALWNRLDAGSYFNAGPQEGLKIRGCQYYLVGIICPLPPLVEIGITDLPKSGKRGRACAPPCPRFQINEVYWVYWELPVRGNLSLYILLHFDISK